MVDTLQSICSKGVRHQTLSDEKVEERAAKLSQSCEQIKRVGLLTYEARWGLVTKLLGFWLQRCHVNSLTVRAHLT